MDAISQAVNLNRRSFEAGDPYNSEELLRFGLESGKLVLITEPARTSAKHPLTAFCILKLDRRVLRLERIAVDPQHRNAGLGRSLISRARKWRDRHRPGMNIWTYISSDNTPSVNAHVHAGFGIEVIGRDWVWVMG
jgi:GNAT superfamily N-acetyltransferase